MAGDSDSGHDSGETELETERLFPSDVSSDPATLAGSSGAAGSNPDADRIAAFEKAAFGSDNPEALRTRPRDRTDSDSGVATATAAVRGEMPRAGQPRTRVLVVAAVVVLLIGSAAAEVAAAIGRDGGAKSSSTLPVVTGEASTSTPSRAQVTTTIAPTVATGAPSTARSTPTSFTVRASCGGRDCVVAVREGPSTGARQVASLRAGQTIQINCSTHGDLIDDSDTGRRSDVWYRSADTNGYSSALYLDGPTVPECG